MREITTHKVEGKGAGADSTRIFVLDEPGPGGACHHYVVDFDLDEQFAVEELCEELLDTDAEPLLRLQFQNGPIQERGVNGVQQEHLLAIVADRLQSFQAGPFANAYNQEALEHVLAALDALHRRTRDRLARGVEGFNKA